MELFWAKFRLSRNPVRIFGVFGLPMINIQKALVRVPALRLVQVWSSRRRRKLRDEEFRAIQDSSSPGIIRMIKPRRIKWGGGHVFCKGHRRYSYEISVGRPEGKRPLERLRRRWKSTKTDLKEAGWGSADCIRKVRERILRWAFANPQKERISSIAEKKLAYEGLCSKDLVI